MSDSATPWAVAHQAPLSMGFSRQEYWSGLPFPSKGDLPNAGIKPRSPALQGDSLLSEPPGKPIYIWPIYDMGHTCTKALFFLQTTVHQPSRSFMSPRICWNSCPLSRWCHPTISSSVAPFFSCPQRPSIRVFSNESTLELQLQHESFHWYSGLISLRID